MDHHSVANGSLTRWNELGNTFHFNETNATGSGNGKSGVITVTRQLVPGVETRLQYHLAVLAFDELSVHGDLWHSVRMVHEVFGKSTASPRCCAPPLNICRDFPPRYDFRRGAGLSHHLHQLRVLASQRPAGVRLRFRAITRSR